MLEVFRVAEADAPYSRLNPMTKFVVFAVFVALPLITSSLAIQLVILLFQVPIILVSKAGGRIARSIRGSLLFIFILIVLNYLTTGNLLFSLAMVMRLVNMILASAIFMRGTSPSEIGDILTKLKVPISITFSFVIALRFIPVLADDVLTIATAQASRGYEFERGGILQRAKRLVPLFVPMIVIAIRRANQLAEALESKAFGVMKRRTSYVEYKWCRTDLLSMAYLAVSATTIVLLSLWV